MSHERCSRVFRCALFCAAAANLIGAASARAEVIEMLDKTKISGTIVHYYDGVFSVETGGNTVKIPKDKVRSISYKLPPPRPEFATPDKTFERWRKALTAGKIDTVIDCYALMYQGFLAAQVGQSADAVKKMQQEFLGTKLAIKGTSIKGDTATVSVTRQKDAESDTGDIAFVKENGEWKMLPPQ